MTDWKLALLASSARGLLKNQFKPMIFCAATYVAAATLGGTLNLLTPAQSVAIAVSRLWRTGRLEAARWSRNRGIHCRDGGGEEDVLPQEVLHGLVENTGNLFELYDSIHSHMAATRDTCLGAGHRWAEALAKVEDALLRIELTVEKDYADSTIEPIRKVLGEMTRYTYKQLNC